MKKYEREIMTQLKTWYLKTESYLDEKGVDISKIVDLGIRYTEIRDELKEIFNE